MSDDPSKPTIDPGENAIALSIRQFIKTMHGLRASYNITIPLVSSLITEEEARYGRFMSENSIVHESKTSGNAIALHPKHFEEFRKIHKSKSQLIVAGFYLPRALIVSIVSAYDAFLSSLLKSIYMAKPEMIEASGKQFTFKELSSFGSIDAARSYLIDKEVENLIRDSHVVQFDSLEKIFEIPLRTGLPSWKTFVELTERRNLYVHTDGYVSDQYIKNCNKHQVDVQGLTVNQQLPEITTDYFFNAWKCVFEIGIKLGHVLWRKVMKKLDHADVELTSMIYSLLQDELYDLAIELGSFSVQTLPKHSSAFNKRMMLMNYCIALKFNGDSAGCYKILDSQDWSDSDDIFKLSVLVLKEDHVDSSALMKKIAHSNPKLNRLSYELWPLFKEFRKTDYFLDVFRSLFGEDYILPGSIGNVPDTGGDLIDSNQDISSE